MEQKIFSQFQKMIETTMVVGDLFSGSIARAAESISSTLLAGGTIFSCGDKSGVLAAELLTNYLTSGFEILSTFSNNLFLKLKTLSGESNLLDISDFSRASKKLYFLFIKSINIFFPFELFSTVSGSSLSFKNKKFKVFSGCNSGNAISITL